MIVSSFEAHSFTDEQQLLTIASILNSSEQRQVAVVSLIEGRMPSEVDVSTLYEKLGIAELLRPESGGLAGSLAGAERLYALAVARYIGWEFLDGRELFILNSDGSINEITYERIQERFDSGKRYIISGSFGTTLFGRLMQFKSSNSGFTGAVTAAGLYADRYEYWSHQTEIRMADPSLVNNPRVIDSMTYDEMRELSSIGFEILPDQIVIPVKQAGIPIELKDTNKPDRPGTLITRDRDDAQTPVVGVFGRTGYCRLFVKKLMVNRDPDYKLKIRTILKIHGVDPEFSSIGFDSLSFYFRQDQLAHHQEIPARIHAELDPDEICTEERISMIGIVGKGLYDRRGVLARISSALSDGNISIRYLNYGGSMITCIIGVDDADFGDAVKIMYHTLTGKSS
jgi:aspartate kinase